MKEQTQALEHASVKQYCKALRVPMIGAEQAIKEQRPRFRVANRRRKGWPIAPRLGHGSGAERTAKRTGSRRRIRAGGSAAKRRLIPARQLREGYA
jgi:hypothetical protein